MARGTAYGRQRLPRDDGNNKYSNALCIGQRAQLPLEATHANARLLMCVHDTATHKADQVVSVTLSNSPVVWKIINTYHVQLWESVLSVTQLTLNEHMKKRYESVRILKDDERCF